MKSVYWKSFKRVFKNGGINVRGWKYTLQGSFDISWLEGVTITIEKRGTEKGCYDMRELYYIPTTTEAELIGAEKNTYSIPLR